LARRVGSRKRVTRKFPGRGLPAVRLARLAVDTRFRGCGYGGRLLAEAIHRTVLIAEHAGVIGLFVDAKDETACLFYQRYGFKSLPDNIRKLFLPIETLRKGTGILRSKISTLKDWKGQAQKICHKAFTEQGVPVTCLSSVLCLQSSVICHPVQLSSLKKC